MSIEERLEAVEKKAYANEIKISVIAVMVGKAMIAQIGASTSMANEFRTFMNQLLVDKPEMPEKIKQTYKSYIARLETYCERQEHEARLIKKFLEGLQLPSNGETPPAA